MDKKLQGLIKNKNIEEINDYLIGIGKNPDKINLSDIKEIIEALKGKKIFSRILINMAWLLGEISKYSTLDNEIINILIQSYYKSDRWIRNEIIDAISKITENEKTNISIMKLLGDALFDDYQPIRINSLRALSNYGNLSQEILEKILKLLDSENKTIVQQASFILKKFIGSTDKLYDKLNTKNYYKSLNSQVFRTILLVWFSNINELEIFRNKLNDSDWDIEIKTIFLKEIDTYQRILIRTQY